MKVLRKKGRKEDNIDRQKERKNSDLIEGIDNTRKK